MVALISKLGGTRHCAIESHSFMTTIMAIELENKLFICINYFEGIFAAKLSTISLIVQN